MGDSEAGHASRPRVPALEEVLGVKFKVLNDGFVRLVDYMGCDEAVVQAARVSYGTGTKRISEDKALLRYLMRHNHTTPFEMCEIKLHVRVPMDTWRQWIRHRTASVNEYSTRYSIAIDSQQRTAPGAWRIQSSLNRQGSEDLLSELQGEVLTQQELEFQTHARQVYETRLKLNVAREQARKDLPLSTYTEAYWKIDLHNLLHFLELRLDQRAQAEIREYARIIGEQLLARWCPITWEAFQQYRLASMRLSVREQEVLRYILSGDLKGARELLRAAGWRIGGEGGGTPTREHAELSDKLEKLGVPLGRLLG